jgi:hypothetical protein
VIHECFGIVPTFLVNGCRSYPAIVFRQKAFNVQAEKLCRFCSINMADVEMFVKSIAVTVRPNIAANHRVCIRFPGDGDVTGAMRILALTHVCLVILYFTESM